MTIRELFTAIANAIREKKGSTDTIKAENFPDEIASISGGGGEKEFTGHVDREGLRQIGWTEEDIDYAQNNFVFWNEEYDDIYKVKDYEMTTTTDSSTRFLHKNNYKTSLSGSNSMIMTPNWSLGTSTSLSTGFSNCYSLISIPPIDTSKITTLANAFNNCYSLRTFPQINANLVRNTSGMFNNCYSLKEIHTIEFPEVTNARSMFFSCYSLNIIDELNFPKNINASQMFGNCYSLKFVKKIIGNQLTDISSMFTNCYSLNKVPEMNTSLVDSGNSLFYNCTALKEVVGLDFSSLKNCSGTFRGCSTICVIDISTLNVNIVVSFSYMFTSCGNSSRKRYGAYADGIPYVYVKDEEAQNWVLTANNGHPTNWSTANVIIAGSAQDLRNK